MRAGASFETSMACDCQCRVNKQWLFSMMAETLRALVVP